VDFGSNANSWDYVIVGAGSAGSAIAGYLSSRNQGKCLLVEAGRGHQSAQVTVPAYYPHTFQTDLDWNYTTAPQKHLANRRLHWPRGKGLGGSSLINAMIYLPGPKEDWMHLAQIWKVDIECLRKKLPHLLQVESSLIDTAWPVQSTPEIHSLSQAFLQAANKFTGKPICDFLHGDIYEAGVFPRSQFAGRRVSAFHSLTALAQLNGWITVKSHCNVSKIILKEKRAIGVETVSPDGTVETILARKAVIVCAGTIESPSLLMRSGIGPEKSLKEIGVRCHHLLDGVGENLQDHLLLPVIFSSRTSSLASRFSIRDEQLYRWQGLGPMTSSIAEAGLFLGGDVKQPPHTQIHFTPTHYLEYPLRDSPTDAFTLGVTLLHPLSRGRVAIQSDDYRVKPVIDPSYLSCDEDMQKLKEGLGIAREIAECEPLRLQCVEELLPGRRRSNDSQIQRSIQSWVQTIYHPVGTCRVGEDSAAVVDHQFRVHGLEGLFIADASVFDRIPSCNPSAQIMALAMLAAERIEDCVS
jgi:choline dehydrogenase